MVKDIEIKVSPDRINDEDYLHQKVREKARIPAGKKYTIILDRRSIDARGRRPLYFLRYKVLIGEEFRESEVSSINTISSKAPTAIIIGAGPAGYFAALKLLDLGIKPIVLERGKDVRERRRDLRAIQQDGLVNPHSNYCFGEGGAGTYSDGKLYTRSHKRGNIKSILQLLVDHGAQSAILIDTHPHIGSNKLPKVVSAIRDTIEKRGGEIHFNAFVVDFIRLSKDEIEVSCKDEKSFVGSSVILATGHSARDIYHLLDRKGIRIEPKPFALGVRIEHSQEYVDKIQYRQSPREENLPAASYSLACQVGDKGVFSFCMCPGGLIVPAATAPGEIVVNGMSLSRRDSPYANSGFVTSIELDELEENGYSGKFGALNFQAAVEQRMFNHGDGSQKAPAQRVADFVEGKMSNGLKDTSYIPGVYSAPLHELLPHFVSNRLRQGISKLDKRMKGYLTNDALVLGTESRTSAPVKVPRDKETRMHNDFPGLFPCGEGAGYAGGILSAAMDGQNVALSVDQYLKK